ncbi:4Fe-4S dicluster domain-containing protein [bacterium]|nr:4Fe-4S dicluster domain-containing protein [bacterium]
MAKVIIDVERCGGCELCVEFCPKKNLRMSETLTPRGIHPAEVCTEDGCTGCKICALMCPSVAISLYKEVAKETK